jgi:hypothetical protein
MLLLERQIASSPAPVSILACCLTERAHERDGKAAPDECAEKFECLAYAAPPQRGFGLGLTGQDGGHSSRQ